MITVATRAALLATILQASASFTWDCSRWRLSGSNLATECDAWGTQDSTTSGKRVQVVAMLDLNDCIGIDPGANAMVWKRGGLAFREWCGRCAFQSNGVTMQCDCVSEETGGRTTSSINLDEGLIVMQSNGHPTC